MNRQRAHENSTSYIPHYRISGPSLAQAVLDGVAAAGGQATDVGVVTTPQLHYNVVCKNTKGGYGEVGADGYFKKLAGAFKKIRGQVLHFSLKHPRPE